VPLRDLATTLIAVIATPELVAGAQVGDGAAWVTVKETSPRLQRRRGVNT
jgi:hypothetical protein